MRIPFWRNQPHGKDKSSAEYLTQVIHPQVERKFFEKRDSIFVEQQHNNAVLLTQFFRDLKQYGINKKNGVYDKYLGMSWGLSFDLFYQVCENLMKDIKNNRSGSKGLFGMTGEKNAASPVVFEKQIEMIMRAFKAFSDGSIQPGNNGRLFKQGTRKELLEHVNFRFGDSTWSKDLIRLNNSINNFVVRQAANRTERAFEYVYGENGQKQKQYTGAVFKLTGRQIKADIIGNTQFNLNVIESYGFSEKMLQVAQLLSKCSFSAKNYRTVFSGDKNMVNIGNTNIISVLYQFLPTLASIQQLSDSQYQSFMMAILRRYFLGPMNGFFFQRYPIDPGQNVDMIGIHFFHIQTVYELIGLGQQVGNSNNDAAEINEMIKDGVQYLIVNQWQGNGDIKVFSCTELLYEMYRNNYQSFGRNIDYRRGSSSAISRFARVSNFRNQNLNY